MPLKLQKISLMYIDVLKSCRKTLDKIEMNIILSTTYLLMNFLFSHPSKSSKLFWRVAVVRSLTLTFEHTDVLLRNEILLATSYMILYIKS